MPLCEKNPMSAIDEHPVHIGNKILIEMFKSVYICRDFSIVQQGSITSALTIYLYAQAHIKETVHTNNVHIHKIQTY